MTIKPGEHIQKFSQNGKVLVFDGETGEMGENAEQLLLQMADEHQKLLKTLCNAAAHQHHVAERGESDKDAVQEIKIADNKVDVSEDDRQTDKKQVNAKLNNDGDCDQLLILANSAEMMLESEVNPSHRDDNSNLLENAGDAAIAGKISAVKQINEMPAIDYRKEKGQSNVRTPRLTQIRRQARARGRLLVHPMIGVYTGWNLQGRRVRLTDVRHLARCKFQMQPQGEEENYSSENVGERTIRLSQLKQMARFKSDSLMVKAIHDSIPAHLQCQTYEVAQENQKAKIIEEIFGVEDSLQVEVDREAPEENISVKGGVQVSQLET